MYNNDIIIMKMKMKLKLKMTLWNTIIKKNYAKKITTATKGNNNNKKKKRWNKRKKENYIYRVSKCGVHNALKRAPFL